MKSESLKNNTLIQVDETANLVDKNSSKHFFSWIIVVSLH